MTCYVHAIVFILFGSVIGLCKTHCFYVCISAGRHLPILRCIFTVHIVVMYIVAHLSVDGQKCRNQLLTCLPFTFNSKQIGKV